MKEMVLKEHWLLVSKQMRDRQWEMNWLVRQRQLHELQIEPGFLLIEPRAFHSPRLSPVVSPTRIVEQPIAFENLRVCELMKGTDLPLILI